jgi:hypothetical protein
VIRTLNRRKVLQIGPCFSGPDLSRWSGSREDRPAGSQASYHESSYSYRYGLDRAGRQYVTAYGDRQNTPKVPENVCRFIPYSL